MVVSQIYRHRKTTGQMQATMTSDYGKLQIFHPIVSSFRFGLFAFFLTPGKKNESLFFSENSNEFMM